jgi:hypothetical protein
VHLGPCVRHMTVMRRRAATHQAAGEAAG